MYAENLLKNLVDYQSEESLIQLRWNNPSMKSKNTQHTLMRGTNLDQTQP